jgi:predicted membrane protein
MQAQFLRKADFSQSPTILLQQFEAFHKKQQWINTKGVIWYTIILNIAFAFYFYETVILAPFTNFWKLFILFVYIVWMLIATFWLGKKSVKKEHEKVNAIIEKIKQLKEGLQ